MGSRLPVGALPQLRQSAPRCAAFALDALATAHIAESRYGAASRAYAELSDRYADQLEHFPADDAALARILSETAPQTVSWEGPVQLKTSKNPIGSAVAELLVNGVRGPWLLDTGANQSVVSRTFAERLGVTPLEGRAVAGSGLTGRESSARVMVLPTMHVGGATLTNVVLVIVDDESLRMGSGRDAYQIDAILGYPVLKALGAVTFTRDSFLAGKVAEISGPGLPMSMRGLIPVIHGDIDGQSIPFTLDTGASSTELSTRYYESFRRQAAAWKTRTVERAGVGGSIHQLVYVQPRLSMNVGTSTVTLKDVSIVPVRTNGSIDILFGNLGQDFFDSFESFSLNLSTMRFTPGAVHQRR